MDIDEILTRLTSLLRAERFDDAVALCAPGLADAERRGDHEEAALLAGALASVLSAQGRFADALDAYLLAERHAPADHRLKLNTAHLLLDALGRAEEAREKALAVQASQTASAGERHAALALVGRAHLHRGEVDRALEALHGLMRAIGDIPPWACDLNLVKALTENGASRADCERYLDLVEQRIGTAGADEEEQSLRAQVASLRRRIRG